MARTTAALLALLLAAAYARADDVPPAVINLPDHTIKDAQGNVASELRNIRLTFVKINPVSDSRFGYSVEWDIMNHTHNVTSLGVNGPDSRIYLRVENPMGEGRIGILLAGRSDCSTRHMKSTFAFKTIAETAARITLEDNGVIGPQAPC